MSKLLTVFGATGNQGGSVIKRVLENPQLSKLYKLRAITRDVTKQAAKDLETKGVELVTANLDDKQSVLAAIKGSSAVFGVTNFWEKGIPEAEIAQGKNIADASKEAGVEHLVWSSLVHVSKRSKGALTVVKHFDSKAEVEEYIRSQNIPASFVLPAMFMSAAVRNIRKGEDDSYTLSFPFPETTQIPLLDAGRDVGLFAAAALLDGPKGKRLAAASGVFTPKELCETYNSVTGRKAQFHQISYDTFKTSLPPPVQDELTGNMKLIEDPGYFVGEPDDAIEQSLALVEKVGLPKPVSLKDFIKETVQ